MVSFRLCLAASFAGKNAETLLGPLGHKLKLLFEKTACSRLILRLCIRDSRRIIGIGGQAIVMRSADRRSILKYNYVLAGSDPDVLEAAIYDRQRELRELQLHLGDIAAPTEYSIAALPARHPMGQLLTICARQPLLGRKLDIFDGAARRLASDPRCPALRRDLRELTRSIRELMDENYWLDIIGPENVVIIMDRDEPRLMVIDTEFYAPAFMDDINPVLGRSYRDVFMERLSMLEDMAGSRLLLPADQSNAVIRTAAAAAA